VLFANSFNQTKMKAKILAVLIFISGWVHAQYPTFNGGNSDGNASISSVPVISLNFYRGGTSDGFAFYTGIAPPPLNFYNGGSSDGFSSNKLAAPLSFNLYNGGSNDGHATYKLNATPFNIYAGGSNDGFAFYTGIAPPQLNFYAGGNNDGFAYSKILPTTTFAMFKGGNGDGLAWDDNSTPPVCNAVNLPLNAISNITTTGSTITWNTVNAGSSYIVKVYDQFNTLLQTLTGLSGVSSNTLNITGLTPNTYYCVNVQERCGTSTYSIVSNYACFTTLPVAVTCNNPSTPQMLGNTSTSVRIGWTPGAGNTGYEVMLIRNSSTDTLFHFGNVTTSPMRDTFSCLPTFTFYSFYVRETCGPGSYSNWIQGSAYTSPGCQPLSALSNKVINTQNANLRWVSGNYYNPSPYQISYGAGISNPTQGTKTAVITPAPIQISGDTITHALFASGGVGNVSWYVREVCRECDTTIWYGPNTLPPTTCTTTANNTLSESAITGTSATLNFTSVNYNSSARIELVDSVGSTTTIYIVSASTNYARSQNVTGLTANRIYKWRVKEYCTTGDSTAYSAYHYFSTPGGGSQTCAAPTNLGIHALAGPNVIVKWSSTQYPNGFKYQVAHGQNLASPNVAVNIITSNYFMTQSPLYATAYLVGGNNTGYAFFVRDICSAGDTSAWAGPYIIGSSKTDETSMELPLADNTDENFNWNIYPNPNRGNLLNITTNKAITGEVVIMDVTGAIVANYKLNEDSNKQLNVDYLSAGIYIVRLRAGEEVYTKKLTISK
jgi:hypothetical protein